MASQLDERRLVDEYRQILGIPVLAVAPACVHGPVHTGRDISARLMFDLPVTHAEAIDVLAGAPGLVPADVIGPSGQALEPPKSLAVVGCDEALVVRIREDYDDLCGANLSVSGGGLVIGAVLNAVQLAELVAA